MSLSDLLIRRYIRKNRFSDSNWAAGDIGLPTYGHWEAEAESGYNNEDAHRVARETRERILNLIAHKAGMARQRDFDDAYAKRLQQTVQEITDKIDSGLITYILREFWFSTVVTASLIVFIVWLIFGHG